MKTLTKWTKVVENVCRKQGENRPVQCSGSALDGRCLYDAKLQTQATADFGNVLQFSGQLNQCRQWVDGQTDRQTANRQTDRQII